MPPAAELPAFAGRALGSTIRLVVQPGRDVAGNAAAERAWVEIEDEFDEVDAALSRFRDDSELTALNRCAGAGGTLPVGRRLRVALALCHRAARLTGGRFDAGMLEVLERLGEHGAPLDDPGPGSGHGWARPGARWPVPVPASPVDLGGIGKGLALRWAARRAMDCLPQGSGLLLDAGGDLVAVGRPPAGEWLVGVEDPAATDVLAADPIAVIVVDAGAVATSSVRVRHWRDPRGRPVHHLLDPSTRDSARTRLLSVTVAMNDPAWAEIWTKALFLAGAARIAEEARTRGIAAWWVDDGGRLGLTPAARLRTRWAAEDRIG